MTLNLRRFEHGNAIKGNTSKTYYCWNDMRKRCLCKTNKRYTAYGGRGIFICERWNSFANFLSDMGEKPEGMTIERKDNDGPYAPWNCKWATYKEQARNTTRTRMIEFNGKTMCLRDWERELGLGYSTIWRRLKRGETIPHALRATK